MERPSLYDIFPGDYHLSSATDTWVDKRERAQWKRGHDLFDGMKMEFAVK